MSTISIHIPPFCVPVSCKYGAPMGRRDRYPANQQAAIRVYLKRVALTQGYDAGGAYWGTGQPLYCAYGVQWNPATEQDDGLTVYLRAVSRDAAKEALRADYPNIEFYR